MRKGLSSVAGTRRLDVVTAPTGVPVGGPKKHYENWIVSPPVVREYPVGFVTAGQIIGFKWKVPVGSIALRFRHEGSVIYTAGTVSGEGEHTLATPIDVADGDQVNPEITSVFSSASDATMSYLLEI